MTRRPLARRLARTGVATAAIAATAAAATACGSKTGSSDAPGGADQPIHIVAAASLTEALNKIVLDYQGKNPNARTKVEYGSSATLAQQLPQRSDVNLFFSADQKSMQTAVDSGSAKNPVKFASNDLAIVVPKGNPGHVTSIADLGGLGTRLALCDPNAPCGRAASAVFAAAKLPEPDKVNRQADVKATLTQVTTGNADAGIVYVTDARSAGDKVETVPLDPGLAAAGRVDLYVATVGDNPPAQVADFEQFVLGAAGKKDLSDFGFTLAQ